MTADQKEDLTEIMASESWKSIMVLIDELIARQGESILTTSVKDERALIVAKAEYDGARKLRVSMDKIRNNYVKGRK